jgi:hypothetical protein
MRCRLLAPGTRWSLSISVATGPDRGHVLDADAELLAAFGPHVPRFRFLLDDLSAQTDTDLRARTEMTAGGRVAILSLKHGRDQVAVRIRVLAPDGRAPAARDVLASVLRYILETSRAEPATLRELLARQVGREAAEEIMTTAEMLRREGEARGVKKGEVLGKRATLLLLLRQRFGRLPAAAVTRIDHAGAAELDVWSGRVLAASSLDDVLGAPVAVPPNEIAFSRRRSGAREASGAETGAKTLVERTRPGGSGRGLEISPRWAGCADAARGVAMEESWSSPWRGARWTTPGSGRSGARKLVLGPVGAPVPGDAAGILITVSREGGHGDIPPVVGAAPTVVLGRPGGQCKSRESSSR